MKRSLISVLLALCLALALPALAESDFDFDATVVCVQPEYVAAAIGGTVASVPVLAGDLVKAGDTLATLSTTKVYAPADGTVTGLFCAPGDSVSEVTERYSALLYIEPDSRYTLTASTDNSYNLSDNKYIHVGETLYLKCSDGKHTGVGFVTKVDGTDFTVEVTGGSFYMGETVSAYRGSGYASRTRVGRGDIARIANIAVTGSASASSSSGGEGNSSGNNNNSSSKTSVAALHVQNGDRVRAGDLLLETLTGEYDGRYCTGSSLLCDRDGILAEVKPAVGGTVAKGDIVATVYPRDRLQLQVDFNEADLSALPLGTPVEITFNWNEDYDDAQRYTGRVSRVLYTAAASAEDSKGAEGGSTAVYSAFIDFDADETVRLGMTATVRPQGTRQAAEEEEAEEEEALEDLSLTDGTEMTLSPETNGERTGRMRNGERGARNED